MSNPHAPQTFTEQLATTKLASLRCGFQQHQLLLMVSGAKNLFAPGTLFTPAYHLHAIHCELCRIDLVRRMMRTQKLNEGRQLQVGESTKSVLPPPIPKLPHNQPDADDNWVEVKPPRIGFKKTVI